MNQKFDNMIKVLAYFADQCDMFQPMLEGVTSLKEENELLTKRVKEFNITQNRMLLNSTYSAHYANFGIETARLEATSAGKNGYNPADIKNISVNDLIDLFTKVIIVGRQNYDRYEMETMLDFYFMIEIMDFDTYMNLWDLMDAQEQEEDEPLIPLEPSIPSEQPNPEENELPLTPLEPSTPAESDVPSEEETEVANTAKKKKFLFK
ncbi:hypothetical protein [Paraclostridium dentum]|uniref:hypothetical protein n=1 Tax=Paraclostridium dentum TaxID=2662455 RepID=UPI003F2E3EE9